MISSFASVFKNVSVGVQAMIGVQNVFIRSILRLLCFIPKQPFSGLHCKSALNLPDGTANPELLAIAKANGIAVYVWTINDPDRMTALLSLGVDGTITDRADLLRQTIDNLAK